MDKDKIIQEAKKQLDNLAAELDKLEEKMKNLTGEAKKVYEEQSAELRSMIKDAEKKYEEAKDSSEETWEEVKGYVELTGKALRNSFHYFLSHYKKK
jgi:Ribonuclease G/E